MQSKPTSQEILQNAVDTLKAAEMGLDDFVAGPAQRRIVGLKNLITFGRSVTFVLQLLRNTEPHFDKWYEPHRKQMESDPLFQFFKHMRNEIEKEGRVKGIGMHIHHLVFSPETIAKAPRPPNATSFFIGDGTGGAGWHVTMPDGSTEKYLVDIPKEMAKEITLYFPDAPKTHLGRSIEDQPIEKLGRMYIDYLRQLVKDAKLRFLTSARSQL